MEVSKQVYARFDKKQAFTGVRLAHKWHPEGEARCLVFTSIDWNRSHSLHRGPIEVPAGMDKVLYKYYSIHGPGRMEWHCAPGFETEIDADGHVNNVIRFEMTECSVCYEMVNRAETMCCNKVCLPCAGKYIRAGLPAAPKCMICREDLGLKTVQRFEPDFLELLRPFKARPTRHKLDFSSWSAFRASYALWNTMPCPRCGILVTKVDGCNHVTCSLCGHSFRYSAAGGHELLPLLLLLSVLLLICTILRSFAPMGLAGKPGYEETPCDGPCQLPSPGPFDTAVELADNFYRPLAAAVTGVMVLIRYF